MASEFCVRAGAHEQRTNNWQSVWAKGRVHLSVHACQLVPRAMSQPGNDGAVPTAVDGQLYKSQLGIGQFGTY